MALETKVKEYREKAGYKQSELAEMVGARRETIVHLENGRYNPCPTLLPKEGTQKVIQGESLHHLSVATLAMLNKTLRNHSGIQW